MKFDLPSESRNNPQNAIVVLGLWICVATLALIFVLNYSARKRMNDARAEVKPIDKNEIAVHPHYSRYAHTGYAASGHDMTRQ